MISKKDFIDFGSGALVAVCGGLAGHYAALGIPAFAYGPGLLSVSHGPDEFIPLDNIESCAAIYALTALRMLGGDERRQEAL